MKYRNIIVTIGFLTFVMQFLGFPQSWDNAFYAVAGILIVAFGYLSGKDRAAKPSSESSHPSVPQDQSPTATSDHP